MSRPVDLRICSYCNVPTDSNMARLDSTDRNSPRVALGPGHEACRLEHSAALRRLQAEADALPAGAAQ